MKNTLVKALFVAAVPFAMNAAFADDITPEPAATPSTLTRAEVLADLAKARAAGELVNGEQTVVAKVPAATVRSRDEVRAEAVLASKNRKTTYQSYNQS
jgi:Domain of unknown function (DUF4148)